MYRSRVPLLSLGLINRRTTVLQITNDSVFARWYLPPNWSTIVYSGRPHEWAAMDLTPLRCERCQLNIESRRQILTARILLLDPDLAIWDHRLSPHTSLLEFLGLKHEALHFLVYCNISFLQPCFPRAFLVCPSIRLWCSVTSNGNGSYNTITFQTQFDGILWWERVSELCQWPMDFYAMQTPHVLHSISSSRSRC
jgi:hypothetical protein